MCYLAAPSDLWTGTRNNMCYLAASSDLWTGTKNNMCYLAASSDLWTGTKKNKNTIVHLSKSDIIRLHYVNNFMVNYQIIFNIKS